MASNPNRPKRVGEKLTVSATAWNRFLTAATWVESNRQQIAAQLSKAPPEGQIALVRNDSDSDKDRGSALGIADSIFAPIDGEAAFLRRVALSGVDPESHAAKFVVLAEPIAVDKVGRAWVSGVCPAKVQVIDENDELADIVDGVLTTGTKGSAKILWKEAGTGTKWALLRLGTPTPRRYYAVVTATYLEQGSSAAGQLLEENGDPGEAITIETVITFGRTSMHGVAYKDDVVEVERNGDDWYAVGTYRLYEQPKAAAAGVEGGTSTATVDHPDEDFNIPVGLCLTDFADDDELACWWNEIKCEWQCATFGNGELGCGLKKDESTDNKLSIDLEELAGFGFEINSEGECPVLDLNCPAVYVCVAPFIPVPGCGIAASGEPPVWSVDAGALAGPFLQAEGGCSLGVNIDEVMEGITTIINEGGGEELIESILGSILGNPNLRKLFCKLACKCNSDPPSSEPPECEGETPIYTCSGGEWVLSDDCGCELPTPPEGTCDECDDPTPGECCGENSTTWRWEP